MSRDEYLEKSTKYYDKRFGEDDQSASLTSEEVFRIREIKKQVSKITKSTSQNHQILDFGCGRGWIANNLKDFGVVTGIDLSPKAVAKAKQQYPDVNFLSGDLGDDFFRQSLEEKFDVVVSSEVIEHLDEQKIFMVNIKKALKPGGMLVLTTPNGNFYNHYFDKSRSHWGQPVENWLNPDNLKSLLQAQNFEIDRYYLFNSDWIFSLKISESTILKLLNNKVFRKIFRNKHGRYVLSSIFKYSSFGLYQMVVAKNS
jgi:2-polyprenyl-3-methyl-5-hydroxy-6-metoxy-1,4-benzoquinol methylase